MNTVYLIDKFMKTVFLLPAFVYIDNFLLFKKRRHRIFFIFHYIHWYALRVVFPRVKGWQAEQLHQEDTGLIVHLPILFSL